MIHKRKTSEKTNSRPDLKVHAPPPPSPAPPKNFLTAREFREILNVSLRTFMRWKAAGRFPRPIRDSGWARWGKDEVIRWLRCGQPDRATWDRLNGKHHEPEKGSSNERRAATAAEEEVRPGEPD